MPSRPFLFAHWSMVGRWPSKGMKGTPYPHESAIRLTSVTMIERTPTPVAPWKPTGQVGKGGVVGQNRTAPPVQAHDAGRSGESAEHDDDPSILA